MMVLRLQSLFDSEAALHSSGEMWQLSTLGEPVEVMRSLLAVVNSKPR